MFSAANNKPVEVKEASNAKLVAIQCWLQEVCNFNHKDSLTVRNYLKIFSDPVLELLWNFLIEKNVSYKRDFNPVKKFDCAAINSLITEFLCKNNIVPTDNSIPYVLEAKYESQIEASKDISNGLPFYALFASNDRTWGAPVPEKKDEVLKPIPVQASVAKKIPAVSQYHFKPTPPSFIAKKSIRVSGAFKKPY